MSEPKYDLKDFSPEEGKALAADIDAVLAKYSAQLVIKPLISENGTLTAAANLYKKVILVPKEEGVPSPFIENGKKDNAKTENSGEDKEV